MVASAAVKETGRPDALLGWNRFVRPLAHGNLAVMVTYHLAQILLFLSLIWG